MITPHINNLDLFTASELKNAGIQLAIQNAERKNEGWGDEAYDALKVFLRTHEEPFMCEQVRDFAHIEFGLVQPSHSRA